ncbi:16237_t:CDS:2, partial [Racocetra fulgida]
MPYKDREKQREAVRKSVQKLREKQKGITQTGNTLKSGMITQLTPSEVKENFSELEKRLEILTSEIKNLREENLFFHYEISEFLKTLPKISFSPNRAKTKSEIKNLSPEKEKLKEVFILNS